MKKKNRNHRNHRTLKIRGLPGPAVQGAADSGKQRVIDYIRDTGERRQDQQSDYGGDGIEDTALYASRMVVRGADRLLVSRLEKMAAKRRDAVDLPYEYPLKVKEQPDTTIPAELPPAQNAGIPLSDTGVFPPDTLQELPPAVSGGLPPPVEPCELPAVTYGELPPPMSGELPPAATGTLSPPISGELPPASSVTPPPSAPGELSSAGTPDPPPAQPSQITGAEVPPTTDPHTAGTQEGSGSRRGKRRKTHAEANPVPEAKREETWTPACQDAPAARHSESGARVTDEKRTEKPARETKTKRKPKGKRRERLHIRKPERKIRESSGRASSPVGKRKAIREKTDSLKGKRSRQMEPDRQKFIWERRQRIAAKRINIHHTPRSPTVIERVEALRIPENLIVPDRGETRPQQGRSTPPEQIKIYPGQRYLSDPERTETLIPKNRNPDRSQSHPELSVPAESKQPVPQAQTDPVIRANTSGLDRGVRCEAVRTAGENPKGITSSESRGKLTANNPPKSGVSAVRTREDPGYRTAGNAPKTASNAEIQGKQKAVREQAEKAVQRGRRPAVGTQDSAPYGETTAFPVESEPPKGTAQQEYFTLQEQPVIHDRQPMRERPAMQERLEVRERPEIQDHPSMREHSEIKCRSAETELPTEAHHPVKQADPSTENPPIRSERQLLKTREAMTNGETLPNQKSDPVTQGRRRSIREHRAQSAAKQTDPHPSPRQETISTKTDTIPHMRTDSPVSEKPIQTAVKTREAINQPGPVATVRQLMNEPPPIKSITQGSEPGTVTAVREAELHTAIRQTIVKQHGPNVQNTTPVKGRAAVRLRETTAFEPACDLVKDPKMESLHPQKTTPVQPQKAEPVRLREDGSVLLRETGSVQPQKTEIIRTGETGFHSESNVLWTDDPPIRMKDTRLDNPSIRTGSEVRPTSPQLKETGTPHREAPRELQKTIRTRAGLVQRQDTLTGMRGVDLADSAPQTDKGRAGNGQMDSVTVDTKPTAKKPVPSGTPDQAGLNHSGPERRVADIKTRKTSARQNTDLHPEQADSAVEQGRQKFIRERKRIADQKRIAERRLTHRDALTVGNTGTTPDPTQPVTLEGNHPLPNVRAREAWIRERGMDRSALSTGGSEIPGDVKLCLKTADRLPAGDTSITGNGSRINPADLMRGNGKASGIVVEKDVETVTGQTVRGASPGGGNLLKPAQSVTVREAGRVSGKTVKTAAKQSGKTIKTAAKQSGKTIKTAAKQSGKAVKTAAQTSGKAVKTAGQTSAKVIRTAERAAAQTVLSARQAAQAAARSKAVREASIRAAKGAAGAVNWTVREIIQSVMTAARAAAASLNALLTALSAGGSVVIVILIVFCLVGLLIAAPFGIFLSPHNGTERTIQTAMNQLNREYQERIQEIRSEIPHQETDIQDDITEAMLNNWRNVLAVYAVRVTTDEFSPEEVVTMTDEKMETLRTVFQDMNHLRWRTTTRIIHHEDGETERIVTLHISVTIRNADAAAQRYHFDSRQKKLLDELLSPDFDELFDTLLNQSSALAPEGLDGVIIPGDVSETRRQVIETGSQLLGRVHYFWGGKSLVLGWDSRWGTPTRVWAAGSPSTGTIRPFGLDCSGFVDWVFYNVSGGTYVIGHGGGASAQHRYCTTIPWSEAQPGDLAFYPGDSHVGIIVGYDDSGNVRIMHCASGSNNVVITGKIGFSVAARPDFYNLS